LLATVFSDSAAQIAYFIFRSHQRRGYAKEACRALVAHLAAGGETETALRLAERLLEF